VTYTIPSLPLLESVYQISVAVVNQQDTETYDYHDRAYYFRVVNRSGRIKERYGLLTLDGKWEHRVAEPLPGTT
jgi:lipopolysaccharide transport system ATP-binding protein